MFWERFGKHFLNKMRTALLEKGEITNKQESTRVWKKENMVKENHPENNK